MDCLFKAPAKSINMGKLRRLECSQMDFIVVQHRIAHIINVVYRLIKIRAPLC